MKQPITSHRHGHGRYAREAWGPKENCGTCMAEEARVQQGREWMKKVREKEGQKEVPNERI